MSAIVFVTSVACYDQTLAEDPTVNRMVDSILLFKAICNHKLLQSCHMILFLNKMDVLERKASPLLPFIEEFNKHQPLLVEPPTSQDSKSISRFFKKAFMVQNQNYYRNVYCHYTTSTDTKQMSFILKTIT
jgi:hypothetical protein